MEGGTWSESTGIARNIARWAVKRYYPDLQIDNADRSPQSGPVLLCANHANSLLDPVLIGIAARRPVRFMAKAPLFDHPVLGPPMKALGMVPAFRGVDDKSQVRRNFESLDVGAKVLTEGHAMGIFPEGKSTDLAHLETVRSGAARMALQALELGAEGVKIVPLGITYQKKDAFRSAVWIQVGEPIDVAEILDSHDGDVRKARQAITQRLETGLKQLVVHLDNPDWEPWLDDLQVLATPAGQSAEEPLKRRKLVADAMNHFLANDPRRVEPVAEKIAVYRKDVRAAGLRVDSSVLRLRGWKVCAKLLWRFIRLIMLLIPAIVGTLHHLVPFVLVRALAAKLDQAGRQTISTNRMLVGAPVYLVWYALVAWWMFGYFAPWFASLWMLAAPFCGVSAVYYWRMAGRTLRLLVAQVRVTMDRDTLKRLRRDQAQLREKLSELAEDYVGNAAQGKAMARPKRRRLVKRLVSTAVGLLLLMAFAWVARHIVLDRPLSGAGLELDGLSPHRVETMLDADEKTVDRLIGGLAELRSEAIELNGGFLAGRRSYDKQKDNDDVRELLRRFIVYREALLRVVWKYQRCDEIDDEKLRTRAFLLDFTAAAMLYEASLNFVHMFDGSPLAIAKLNEAAPNWDVPPGFYDTVRNNLASPGNMNMFATARGYYHQDGVQELFEKHGLKTSQPYGRFHAAIAQAEETIRKKDHSLPEKIIEVAAVDLQRLLGRVQYQTQSAVSTWIGDFKIREPRDGESLIDEKHLAELAKVLQPGDVLLERRNWYLSNAFLPGYWPHGAIYVGTAEDLRRRGLDRNKHVKAHWDEFAAKDEEGHEHVIIEAISEGVIFSSLEHSIGGADSVAVLRPRLGEEEKNEAIRKAFSYAGRPYDFEFDFETTDTLVCTEVVYRAYGGNSGKIEFPLEEIMGRKTMPAINLVKKFNREYETDEAQFDFVAFIDGDEHTGTARFSTDVEAFRRTVDRPASSFVQRSDPYAMKSIGPLGGVLLGMTALCAVIAAGTAARRRLPKPDVMSER